MSVLALLAVTTVVAAYLIVSQAIGYATAAVFSVSVPLLYWAVRSQRRRWFLPLRVLSFVVGSIVFWITGIDGRWTFENCPSCGWGRETVEFRILGIPVWTQYDEDSSDVIYFVLRDLEWDCNHPNAEFWVKHRYWGGQFCACPCINGIMGLYSGFLHNEAAARRIREAGKADQGLASRLHRKYFDEDDRFYLYRGLLLDWRTLGALDVGRALNASDWKEQAPDAVRLEFEEHHDFGKWENELLGIRNPSFPDYVEQLLEAGASEVLVVWEPWNGKSSKLGEVCSSVVVRLPSDDDRRRHVFATLRKNWAADGIGDPYPDYGQEFAYASDLVDD